MILTLSSDANDLDMIYAHAACPTRNTCRTVYEQTKNLYLYLYDLLYMAKRFNPERFERCTAKSYSRKEARAKRVKIRKRRKGY